MKFTIILIADQAVNTPARVLFNTIQVFFFKSKIHWFDVIFKIKTRIKCIVKH